MTVAHAHLLRVEVTLDPRLSRSLLAGRVAPGHPALRAPMLLELVRR